MPINELAASYDGFLPETLVARFRYLVPGNSATHLKQDDTELILRRLRDAGQIVLLFDALDQTGAASPQIATLCQIGQDAQPAVAVIDDEGHPVDAIMRCANRRHLHRAEIQGAPRGEAINSCTARFSSGALPPS